MPRYGRLRTFLKFLTFLLSHEPQELFWELTCNILFQTHKDSRHNTDRNKDIGFLGLQYKIKYSFISKFLIANWNCETFRSQALTWNMFSITVRDA